ncbi:GMC family oxidoreductase [Acinetobacter oleivorans]|uniref:GMC oxidoreductase n=1 Tax=Acinetobacter oleivorans TaxID=1148157 RepID=UPI003A89F03E
MRNTSSDSPLFDYDWVVIGSGFGGSVSALRLAEKGYRVAVLERGKRYKDEDLPKSTWQLSKFLWVPSIGWKGIMRMKIFRHVFFPSQSAVGGGSTVYGGVLYRARPEFFKNPQWNHLSDDWQQVLTPFYDKAEYMLGVETIKFDSTNQNIAKEMAAHFGCSDGFKRAPTGIFFGEPDKKVPDPYFGGEGPERTGCIRCGACMVGCRVGAVNSLSKNYLWFAEKKGVQIFPEHQVTDIKPLNASDGSDGYHVTVQTKGLFFTTKITFSTKGVVFAGGALGTNELLANCKLNGSLPNISNKLGQLVRTNSESVLNVRLPKDLKTWNDVTASSSVHIDQNTHIEFLTYGRHADFMSLMYTVLVGNGNRLTRPLKWLWQIVRHPAQWLKTVSPIGWSQHMITLLVMQSLDNSIQFLPKKRWFGSGYKLITKQNSDKPNPTYIDIANQAAQWVADYTGGVAQSNILEAIADIPTTAHVLGGAVIGKDAAHGVIDHNLQIFGYKNLLVCDGSAMPANPGVNPALTITALAEYAMSKVIEP